MNIYLLFILGLIIPLVILFVFSIYIIISVLNRKNIKLDLFAFNFRFKKRRNIENTEQVVNTLNQQQAVPQAQAEPNMPASPVSDATQQESLMSPKRSMQDFPEDTDFQDNMDTLGGLDALEDFSDFDDFELEDEQEESFFGRMKNKFFGIRQDAKARAIEREEMRMQDNLEIYDPDEIPEDMPEDFGSKLKYWWHNHIGFRIGICSLAAFLMCVMVFYGFQARNRGNEKPDTEIAENADRNKDKNKDTKKNTTDAELDEFRQGLDDELLPVDVASTAADPDLAEIVATAQSNVGATPASYSGSSTKTQPSGSIDTISIPSINLSNAPVMGSVALSDLSKGTGHFENTPLFDGNVGIAGHNNTHFKYLVNVDIGDTIKYTVNGVTRTYQVTDMRAISDTDWGVFNDQGDNRLTLVTCEHLVPNSRIAVTAVQVGADSGTSKKASANTVRTASAGKSNSSNWQDSGEYHDAGSGYTDYVGVFTGNN